jgi:DNA-binding transcriptional LysR family regulator
MALHFTIRQLEYFVAVGIHGSIVQAAEKMNVSSPSISTAITQLESEFGLQLFIRKHAHGLSLTQGGRQFLAQARCVLAEAEQLNAVAGNITGQVQGALNIGCLSTFAQLVLPQLRQKFEADFPQINIKQTELHQAAIFQQLRNTEIDVALTYDLEIPPDIAFTPMLELPPYAMLSVSHPLVGHTRLAPEELAQYPMILLDLPISSDYFLSFFIDAGLKPRIAERTGDMAVMRSLVANDYGFALANICAVSTNSPDGKSLRFVPLSGSLRSLQLGLAYSKNIGHSGTIQAFMEHCKQIISAEDVPGLKTLA